MICSNVQRRMALITMQMVFVLLPSSGHDAAIFDVWSCDAWRFRVAWCLVQQVIRNEEFISLHRGAAVFAHSDCSQGVAFMCTIK